MLLVAEQACNNSPGPSQLLAQRSPPHCPQHHTGQHSRSQSQLAPCQPPSLPPSPAPQSTSAPAQGPTSHGPSHSHSPKSKNTSHLPALGSSLIPDSQLSQACTLVAMGMQCSTVTEAILSGTEQQQQLEEQAGPQQPHRTHGQGPSGVALLPIAGSALRRHLRVLHRMLRQSKATHAALQAALQPMPGTPSATDKLSQSQRGQPPPLPSATKAEQKQQQPYTAFATRLSRQVAGSLALVTASQPGLQDDARARIAGAFACTCFLSAQVCSGSAVLECWWLIRVGRGGEGKGGAECGQRPCSCPFSRRAAAVVAAFIPHRASVVYKHSLESRTHVWDLIQLP